MRYTHATESRRYRASDLLNRRLLFRDLLVREAVEFTEHRGWLTSTFTVVAPPAWHDTFTKLGMRRVK